MKYRNFSEEMQEKDLKEVLEIIYPDTIFCGYKRMEREIKIFFKLHGKIRSCVLLADQVVDMPNRMELDIPFYYIQWLQFGTACYYCASNKLDNRG